MRAGIDREIIALLQKRDEAALEKSVLFTQTSAGSLHTVLPETGRMQRNASVIR